MPSARRTWMIYGATGYTGRLVTDRAVARGLRPILAGRSPAVEALAARHGLPSRVFDLRDPQTVREAVAGCGVVAHCAGPFSATSDPMVDACLAAGTDYVDITGEIEVFEASQRRDADARATGVVLCPAAGVVLAVEHLLDRDGPGGFFTPSRLIGPRCVESLPGSGRTEIEVRGP